jgi:hypothetical protein
MHKTTSSNQVRTGENLYGSTKSPEATICPYTRYLVNRGYKHRPPTMLDCSPYLELSMLKAMHVTTSLKLKYLEQNKHSQHPKTGPLIPDRSSEIPTTLFGFPKVETWWRSKMGQFDNGRVLAKMNHLNPGNVWFLDVDCTCLLMSV